MLKRVVQSMTVAATLLVAPGCEGIHYEQEEDGLDTLTVFDGRLPSDVDSVFA